MPCLRWPGFNPAEHRCSPRSMDVEEAIRLRRSVKPEKMRTDPIPDALLESLLEAANWAPSHGLTEPWRFIVFRGAARDRLGEAILSAMVPPGEPAPGPDDPRHAKIMTKVRTAPVCLAIVCAPSSSANIFEHEEIASVAMAVQNLQLLARSHGLGTFWSSGKKAFDPRMAAFLGLEGTERCLGFLYVGWPAQPFAEGTRGPMSRKVRYEEA